MFPILAGVLALTAQATYVPGPVSDGATLRGKVETSTPASTGTLPVTQDGEACGDSVPDETVVVTGGMLANAIVFLDGIEAGAPATKASPRK